MLWWPYVKALTIPNFNSDTLKGQNKRFFVKVLEFDKADLLLVHI